MSPVDTLRKSRAAIVVEWVEDTLKDYPPETRRVLAATHDRFRNPAGFVLRENLAALFDALIGDDLDAGTRALAELVRLRAAQGFSREQAIDFLQSLKRVAREAPGSHYGITRGGAEEDSRLPSHLDARIDHLRERGLEIYDDCRARMDAIRANEARRRTWLLDRMAGSEGASRSGTRTLRPAPSTLHEP